MAVKDKDISKQEKAVLDENKDILMKEKKPSKKSIILKASPSKPKSEPKAETKAETKKVSASKTKAKSEDNKVEKKEPVKKIGGFKEIEKFLDEQEKKIKADLKEKAEKEELKKLKDKDSNDEEKASKTPKSMFDDNGNGEYNNIVTKSVESVLHDSMLPYSEFVILDRALPRVEDGLKPVQRRVLYSMLEVGVLPDKPYRKSARIVGDCMGKYHPHGDSSIYGTLVRMAQDFNMGEVLVDGHGNFGSVDGDGAAAMRYTEAKLAPIALELLRDIEKDTVPWVFNFDDSCKEPEMLPGRFPNLLVNGAMGIAVGLATNIPTHNLREVCKATCAYIDNRDIDLDELLKIMPGPDFPTGAFILNNSEIKQIYKTGKGKVYVRSKITIENADGGKKNIIITEIPYQVNKAALLQKIATLKENDETGVLAFIQDIVDESDRHGNRAIIKLKKDAKVGSIIAMLLKNTDLQTNFNVNMVAIADGKPKQMGLIEILEYYVNYQQKIIYNRTRYDLEACLKKEHILEGLLIAINNIDEVVRIIKTSKNVTEAKITLIQTFTLSEVQAQAILDMRLARLTSLEVNKLIAELNRLRDLIKRYTAILKSPAMQMKIVKKELMEIAENYGSDRKTQFLDPSDDLPEEDATDFEEEVSDIHIIFTPQKTIKSIPDKSYGLAIKDAKDVTNLYEIPEISIKTKTNKTLYCFTNLGNCFKINAGKVSLCRFKDRGANVTVHYKNLEDNEFVVTCMELDEKQAQNELIFFTKKGMIKTTKVEEYFASKQCIGAIKLKDETDALLGVQLNKANMQVAIFTKNGIGMIVPKDDITATGRMSAGVKGLNLADDDEVVSAFLVNKKDNFTTFFDNGGFKILVQSAIPKSLRNKKGTKILGKKLATCKIVRVFANQECDYILQSNKNALISVKASNLTLENIDSIGKYSKSLRGDKVLQAVYPYVVYEK